MHICSFGSAYMTVVQRHEILNERIMAAVGINASKSKGVGVWVMRKCGVLEGEAIEPEGVDGVNCRCRR